MTATAGQQLQTATLRILGTKRTPAIKRRNVTVVTEGTQIPARTPVTIPATEKMDPTAKMPERQKRGKPAI
jgi:hypothetical protein